MGYSISWLAIKSTDENATLDSLGLDKRGETGDFGESVLTGRSLFPDWYLLVVSDRKLYSEHKKFNFYMLEDAYLKNISQEQQIVTCMVNETAMCSSCAIWENGEQIFEVSHTGDETVYDLTVTGKEPEIFSEIREKYFKQQDDEGGQDAGVDYIFEIPTVLAYELTGFKHDVMDSLESPSYDFLSFEWPDAKPKNSELSSSQTIFKRIFTAIFGKKKP